MYLKSIKLAGFKSFVEPTHITVRSHMNAVVGPNGCGKSNIVDAIRWVIGESSAKQLRGQSMSDVIFNGTTQRKAVGRAMVELHFDNSAGRIQGEYAQYTDLVIKRVVDRSGQSNYFLNGSPCRRRDIIDVFLGTGLGPRSYSIIEQGMIAQIIEAKPEDMRQYLEEVAGISKYKERRRETENRLQHTQENLDRLNDIRQELDKQLRHLKRQATVAESYTQLKQEEHQYGAQLKTLHWKALEERRTEQNVHIHQSEVSLEKHIATQRQHESELEKMGVAFEEATQTEQILQKNDYQLAADITYIEQRITHQREQQHRWERELYDLNQHRDEMSNSTLEYQTQLSALEKELAQLQPQKSTSHDHTAIAEKAFGEADKEMAVRQIAYEAAQKALTEIETHIHVTRTKSEYHLKALHRLEQQQQERTTQLSALPIDTLRQTLAPLEGQLQSATENLEQIQTQLQCTHSTITALGAENKNRQHDIQQQQEQLQSLEREHAKLSGLQQAALGTHHEGNKQWLEQSQLHQHARLGQKMTVTAGWETAVETVLSGYFDAICLAEPTLSTHLPVLTALTTGRITLLEPGRHQKTDSRLPQPTLMSQIQSEWPCAQWLRDIYTANTLEEALALRHQLMEYESVITPDGLWLGKQWARRSRIHDPQHGILEREQMLSTLTEKIEKAGQALEILHHTQKNAERKRNEQEQLRDQAQDLYQQNNKALATLQKEWNTLSGELAALYQNQKRFQDDLIKITADIENNRQQCAVLEKQQDDYQLQRIQWAQHCQEADVLRDQQRLQLEKCRTEVQLCKQQLDEFAIRISASENQRALLQQTMQRDAKQLAQSMDKQECLQDQLCSNHKALKELESELQTKLAQRLDSEQSLKAAKKKTVDLRHVLKTLEHAKQAAMYAVTEVKAELEQLRIHLQELLVRQQTITEQLEASDLTLTSILSTLPADAQIPAWEAHVKSLQERVQRLGPINLAAVDEYTTGSERSVYLSQQADDLANALHTLEDAMRKMDHETKIRFKETFDQVNHSLQIIFPQVFGGGRASLELLNDDDILTAGVLVHAQPPGKRNASIHMLSGGEKALTAISLIFAMFRLNPAPFCILDEVDAPLDDVNVGRFCQLIREMSKETQFLVISHNKATIEKADHLIGVTMQEAGVSRLVAVDMQEALDMVAV